MVKGETKGKEGVVVGKIGGLPDGNHHVVVYFEEDVLDELSIGDKIQVRNAGIRLTFDDHPEIRAVGISRQLLDSMGFVDKNGKLSSRNHSNPR